MHGGDVLAATQETGGRPLGVVRFWIPGLSVLTAGGGLSVAAVCWIQLGEG
jgi:hypothetical protein